MEPTQNLCLFVDDVRVPKYPNPYTTCWVLARTFQEAIKQLEHTQYDVVSLDHDIDSFIVNDEGNDEERTGYHIAVWLAERKNDGQYVPKIVLCHSANPVGRKRIEGVIERYLK